MEEKKETKYTHQMFLFIAENKINEMMKAFDMRLDHKWFVSAHQALIKAEVEVIPETYYQTVIDKSWENREENGWWIPVLRVGDKFYKASGVKVISDGEKEMFL